MKKLLTFAILVLIAMTATAQDGTYLVDKNLKAWPYKGFKGSLSDIAGVYVERSGQGVFTSWEFKNYEKWESAMEWVEDVNKRLENQSKTFNIPYTYNLPKQYELDILMKSEDYNEAMFDLYKSRGKSTLDYEEPIDGNIGNWDFRGRYIYMGNVAESDKDTYAKVLLVYHPEYMKRIVKQTGTAPTQKQVTQQATAQGSGVYLVNKDLKAWPWNQYDASIAGNPIGIYVEYGPLKVMTLSACKYITLAEAKNAADRFTETRMPSYDEIQILQEYPTDFNNAMQKCIKIEGGSVLDFNPVATGVGQDKGIWIDAGEAMFVNGNSVSMSSSSRAVSIPVFKSEFTKKVVKQAGTGQVKPRTSTGGQAGTLKATATIRTIDKSGAHYQNRGYTYTNLIEDITVTFTGVNKYFQRKPSGMQYGGSPIIRVYLVKFLPNGNPEVVSTNDVDILPSPTADLWKDPQTQTVRFKTPWNKLWNRYGQGTVKYQYQVAIPRKAGPELIYKSPVRQITITNIPQPRR